MRIFHHLSLEEREKLFAWREKGLSFREIGRRLRRSVGTISREVKRHTKYGRKYLPCLAQRRASIWAARQRYHAPLKCPLVFLYVREHLREYHWSPETIAGRLPMDHSEYSIHHETIYRYIYGRKQKRMKLWSCLQLHRKRRLKKDGRKVKAYGRLNEAIPIILRPTTINNRLRPGDWETDNMEGKRTDESVISVTVDRMSRITRIRKLADHTATAKTEILTKQIQQEDALARNSLTVDRGVENSNHKDITRKTGIPVYACNPYHSWEKGTVENMIGRIRRYIPKGKSVDGVNQEKLNIIEEMINNTPRKCLRYLTPNEYLERILTASRTP